MTTRSIPTPYTVEELGSLAKAFEGWHTEHHHVMNTRRNTKIKKFVKVYMGWIISILQVLVQIKKEFF